MANLNPNKAPMSIDPSSGFCSKTSVYHSVRLPVPFPPPSTPLSFTGYALSLLASHPPPETAVALIDASTSRRISYTEFIHRTKALSFSLHSRFGLSKGDCALIVSPNSVYVPILYYALLSLGVIVSPINPISTKLEILHYISLSKPAVTFATFGIAHKVPPLRLGTILLDSPEFESLMTNQISELGQIEVLQSETAAILYSSGTTGKSKGVELTHRNWISSLAASNATRAVRKSPSVCLFTVPYFHVYGFGILIRSLPMGETVVCMEKFEGKAAARVIEEHKVSHLGLSPTAVLMMAKDARMVEGRDLGSLEVVYCGGAPLGKAVAGKFKDRFPHVQLAQAYGLTETTGRIFVTLGPIESKVLGATGKLLPGCEAKIVDLISGIPQPPLKLGELWLRGPIIMKGYVGDDEATKAVLDSGWLRTGDTCYIDDQGFLFYKDRIKEMIKYKGYQVAPAELEHLLQSHPEIADAAIAPYPDEEAGQIPMAFVVRQSGSSIDSLQIKAFVAEKVSPYKKIRKVMFLKSIPKNAGGKVLRKELTRLAMLNANSKM